MRKYCFDQLCHQMKMTIESILRQTPNVNKEVALSAPAATTSLTTRPANVYILPRCRLVTRWCQSRQLFADKVEQRWSWLPHMESIASVCQRGWALRFWSCGMEWKQLSLGKTCTVRRTTTASTNKQELGKCTFLFMCAFSRKLGTTRYVMVSVVNESCESRQRQGDAGDSLKGVA